MSLRAVFSFLLLLSFAGTLRAELTPLLRGVVTEPGTPAHFQVNGVEVACLEGQTITSHRQGTQLVGTLLCGPHFLGEGLLVYGSQAKRHGVIRATSLVRADPGPVAVHGTALTDLVISKGRTEVIVRADGYLLHLSPDTRMTYESTLKPDLSALQTNQWISYRGIAHPDGTVMVQSASLGPNVISDAEDKLRTKTDFDAAAVTEADRQSGLSQYLLGVDRTRLPATDDPALEQRIARIGNRLVPHFQRALPKDDPSKIDFRFQVVKGSKPSLFALPSGIVLISEPTVPPDLTDDQVAALLATGVAMVLQKQELRYQPAKHAMWAGTVAGAAAGLILPGAGLISLVANADARERIALQDEEQNARVSFCLLSDAGFDLAEAPRPFWSIGQGPGKKVVETPITGEALYRYRLLGTAWRTPDEPLPSAQDADERVAARDGNPSP